MVVDLGVAEVVGINVADIEPVDGSGEGVTWTDQVGEGSIRTDDAIGTENEAITELLEVDFGLVEGDVLTVDGDGSTELPQALNRSVGVTRTIIQVSGEDGFVEIGVDGERQWVGDQAAVVVFIDRGESRFIKIKADGGEDGFPWNAHAVLR